MSRLAFTSSTSVVASPSGSAETRICQVGFVGQILDAAPILILWFVEFIVGTSGNSAQVLIRRGALTTSPNVNAGQATTVVAGNQVRFSGSYVDTQAGAAMAQYCLTLTVGSAAAASSINDVFLAAACL